MGDDGQGKLARLLLEKAAGDEAALRQLLDSDVPDEILGFHAQQAIEKSLKAVLALRGVDSERTHNLSYLLALIDKQGVELPGSLSGVDTLSPWAVEFRYEAPLEHPALDRDEALSYVKAARTWATKLVEAHGLD